MTTQPTANPQVAQPTPIRKGSIQLCVKSARVPCGHIPMYPGELERRAQKKASKRALRRAEKLERRKIQGHEYE